MKKLELEPFSLKMYIGSAKTYDFYIFVCFSFMFAHTCFHLIPNVHIVRTFGNRVPFQTFEKWLNVSYRYVSQVKPETSDIRKIGIWFLKHFGESVEENHIYHLVKPNSTVKTRTVYRECNVCYEVFFWKMEKLTLRAKFEILTQIFTPKLIFSLKLH